AYHRRVRSGGRPGGRHPAPALEPRRRRARGRAAGQRAAALRRDPQSDDRPANRARRGAQQPNPERGAGAGGARGRVRLPRGRALHGEARPRRHDRRARRRARNRAAVGHLRPRPADPRVDSRTRHAADRATRLDDFAPCSAGTDEMNFAWAALIVVTVGALAVVAMLLVRRRAPEGSYFEGGDRAAGVFGVLATGFAVLLGFVVFLAFESFDTSRSGAETEAEIVTQQFETAQFFPVAARGPLSGALVCYARTVVNQEWSQMRAGVLGDKVNPWGVVTFRILKTVKPRSPTEQAAFA